jgi:hypothetical protein
MRRTEGDLRVDLEDQVANLFGATEAFDCAQDDGERRRAAQRGAVVARVLLHDTAKSHSLLAQLGIKDSLQMLDSAPELDEEPCVSQPYLTVLGRTRFLPRFSGWARDEGSDLRWTDFSTWWERPVIQDSRGNQFSRRDLVLTLCNKDGAAHVDSELPGSYYALTRDNSMDWIACDPEGVALFPSPVPPSVRQVLFEVASSLAHEGNVVAICDVPDVPTLFADLVFPGETSLERLSYEVGGATNVTFEDGSAAVHGLGSPKPD